MRLIDADTLEKDANEDLLSNTDTAEEVYWNDGAKSIIDLIKTAPTIDPVKHGKWVDRYEDGDWHCTECGAIVEKNEQGSHNWRYCYHCGARMKRIEE